MPRSFVFIKSGTFVIIILLPIKAFSDSDRPAPKLTSWAVIRDHQKLSCPDVTARDTKHDLDFSVKDIYKYINMMTDCVLPIKKANGEIRQHGESPEASVSASGWINLLIAVIFCNMDDSAAFLLTYCSGVIDTIEEAVDERRQAKRNR